MSRRRFGDPAARDPGRRQARVNDLLRRQLGLILEREFRDRLPALVTITEIRTSPDLRHAKVYASVLAERPVQDKAIELLHHMTPEIRQFLAGEVLLRYLPTLEFVLDLTAEYAQHIDDLIHDHDPREKQ
jgi:ribosome-binding factor A